MIEEWRTLWQMPDMPFIFVQLAGFSDGKLHTDGIQWARLREAQRKTAGLPYAMMVQAYDLGEYNDLHPTDKKTVGVRAALAAETLIYGRNVSYRNPELAAAIRNTGSIKFVFEPSGILFHTEKRTLDLKEVPGVSLRQDKNEPVRGFDIICKDGSRKAAEGKLTGENTVEVSITEDTVGVSYAWNDCPWEANLYSDEELPVVPFQIIFQEIS